MLNLNPPSIEDPMRELLRSLLIAVALVLAPPAFCAAQQAQPVARTRVPALVAISPDLQGAETPFRLARFGGNSPRDVILLAPDADASALTQAVEALIVARRQSGDAASTSATFRVQQSQRARVLPWAARVLLDVRGAAPREIPGVGRLRAVQIWLPSTRRGT
ncbi:MAG TPA: hypothetical protein VF006_34435 [Longimicrobium sp.]